MRNWAAGLAFPLTVFLALAALTGWLRVLTDIPDPSSDGRFRHEPDYQIEQFRANQLASTGSAEYTLAADRLLHFPDSDESVVDAPRLTHKLPDGDNVEVAANHGTLNHTADILRLTGNVRVVKTAGRTPEMRFDTDALTVIPDAGLATGSGPATATDSLSSITGVGFSGDFNSHTFVLHDAVKGRFIMQSK